eukprot:795828-Rhodomonas_salina.2
MGERAGHTRRGEQLVSKGQQPASGGEEGGRAHAAGASQLGRGADLRELPDGAVQDRACDGEIACRLFFPVPPALAEPLVDRHVCRPCVAPYGHYAAGAVRDCAEHSVSASHSIRDRRRTRPACAQRKSSEESLFNHRRAPV